MDITTNEIQKYLLLQSSRFCILFLIIFNLVWYYIGNWVKITGCLLIFCGKMHESFRVILYVGQHVFYLFINLSFQLG